MTAHVGLDELQAALDPMDRRPQLMMHAVEHDARVLFHDLFALKLLLGRDVREDENYTLVPQAVVRLDPDVVVDVLLAVLQQVVLELFVFFVEVLLADRLQALVHRKKDSFVSGDLDHDLKEIFWLQVFQPLVDSLYEVDHLLEGLDDGAAADIQTHDVFHVFAGELVTRQGFAP